MNRKEIADDREEKGEEKVKRRVIIRGEEGNEIRKEEIGGNNIENKV